MSQVAYVSIGLTSYLNSSFGLCRWLADAGHQVTYLCSHAEVEDRVRNQGFEFVHLKRDRELIERSRAHPRPRNRSPKEWSTWFRIQRQLRKESVLNDEIEQTLRDLDADAVIADMECHFAIMAAVQAGYPTVLASILFNMYQHPDVPPTNSLLIPDGSLKTKILLRLSWWKLHAESFWIRARRPLSRSGMLDVITPVSYHTVKMSDLKAVAQARGFALGAETSAHHFLRPYMYTRLPLFYLCPWELEFPHSPKPNVHYLGLTVLADRAEVSGTEQEPAAWDAVKARRESAAAGPLVYCSLGSYVETDLAFLRRVIEVFRRREDWELILGLGGKAAVDELGELPANVTALAWAPQVEILQHADLAITHGGPSTILECVRFGVPMVAYSTRFFDQNGNTARLVYHGLGVSGDKDSDGETSIESAIETVLSNDTFASNVRNMREKCMSADPAAYAVRFIEDLIKNRAAS